MNREMMVASSEQLTVAKVGLCDLTAHQSLLLRRNDWGESFPAVVHSILLHGRWSRMKDVQHVGETKLNCFWHCYQSFRICLYVRIILMKLYCNATKVSTLVLTGKKVSTQDSCVLLPQDYLVTTFHQIQMKLPCLLMHRNGQKINTNIHVWLFLEVLVLTVGKVK